MTNGAPGVLAVSLCCLLAIVLVLPSDGSAQEVLELKPNLRPLPAHDLAVVADAAGGTRLIFATTSWNNGDGPLELRAGEIDSGSERQNVYQRVPLSDGGSYDRLAGTFVWHPQHNHFHFEDYALYTLQPADAPGASDRTSSKTTFCVMDTGKVDGRLPGAPRKAVYATCGATVQGMSVGWGDTYGNALFGQSIDLTGLPDGDYRLIIEIDPKRRLLEIDEGDNVSCVLLRISVSDRTMSVLDNTGCAGSGAEVLVSSIVPSATPQGTVVGVTISGSGFVPGMTVSFENGSPPRPFLSDVVVHDANTITANVTAKNGGSGRDRTWDVRVGSGVLADGFTVLP